MYAYSGQNQVAHAHARVRLDEDKTTLQMAIPQEVAGSVDKISIVIADTKPTTLHASLTDIQLN